MTVIKVDQATRDELNHVMDFIYNGQVLVSQEQLETFIKLGHLFKLKGMVDEKYSVDLNTSVEDEDIDCVVILGLDDVKKSPDRKDIFSYAREEVKEEREHFSSEVYERIMNEGRNKFLQQKMFFDIIIFQIYENFF